MDNVFANICIKHSMHVSNEMKINRIEMHFNGIHLNEKRNNKISPNKFVYIISYL